MANEYVDNLVADNRRLMHDNNELTKTIKDVGLCILGASRQGFTNEEQRQAIFFALEAMTGLPYTVLRLMVASNVTPKGFVRWDPPGDPEELFR